MTPEEQYPSTDDCAIYNDGQDLVLACMQNARKRIEENWTKGAYINTTGGVCAIGAVLAECGGFTYIEFQRMPQGMTLWEQIEGDLRDEAKEAIELLNEAAWELHPEADPEEEQWQGPLEWVNQEWEPPFASDTTVKDEVLRIYDHAIEQRQAVAA